jgi:hypothetical protein
VALVVALGWVSNLAAAPKDAAATKMADEAINTDYLATNFAAAEKKLRDALTLCGTSACSPQVRARLHRDLGVVLIAGLHRPDDGKKAFADALQADPEIGLEKALTTPEIDKIFKSVKSGGGAPARPASSAPSATPPAAQGDMIHTPPAEQVALTPVPIYVELPSGVTVVKVVARYKPFGSPEWKTLELRKLGSGYGGEVPCRDVGSATGELLYFVQATDTAGDVVSMSGTRSTPHKVPIKNAITAEPPHLPGVAPPAKCTDSADCPPGLPGCPSGKGGAGSKGWGVSCEQDSECSEGLSCKNGVCESGEKEAEEPKASGRLCDTSAECETGETCTKGVCEREASGKKGRKVWLSLNLGQDISFIGSQPDVCGTPEKLHAPQYTCIDQDGYLYEGIPEPGGPGKGNSIKGGPHLATTRIMAGLDVLIANNVTLGTRVGYVFGTAPGRSLSSLHVEGRVAFWFGREPFARERIRPYLVVAGGLAAIDDKLEVPISETDLSKSPYATQTLTAWRRTGGGFVGGGGGALFPFAPGHGILAELKLQAMFPDFGLALAPSIGYALGF